MSILSTRGCIRAAGVAPQAERRAMMDLIIAFDLHAMRGEVRVDIRPSHGCVDTRLDLLDPELPPEAGVGLPVCTARVTFDGAGYDSVMGWVQFVRSTDSSTPTEFELDPVPLLRDADVPYAFFGMTPTLFDAPYREPRSALTWTARSYLAVTPDAVMSRRALPVAAFTWGFRISEGEVTIDPPAELSVVTWAEHVPLLNRTFPNWDFGAHAS
jgi:hypothetical protein